MTAEPAGIEATKLPATVRKFYAHLVHGLPCAMSVLHLPDPAREGTWTVVAANSQAKRLIKGRIGEYLKLALRKEPELKSRPVDAPAGVRAAFNERRGKTLGYLTGETKFRLAEVFAVQAVPLEENCMGIRLLSVTGSLKAQRHQAIAEAKAQERERKRISRDLHDSVGQYLTGLHWNLSRLQRDGIGDKKQREQLKECAQMVHACMEEVRAISYALHPPAIEMLGLATALKWQVRRFAEQSSMKIHADITDKIARMDGDREITLYRVLQECLSNVRRHANTDEAFVRLRQESDAVILEVEDHGTGVPNDLFEDLARGRRGVGLLKMRERLVELGGLLEIASRGKGTMVRATLPREKNSAAAGRKAPALHSARRNSGRG